MNFFIKREYCTRTLIKFHNFINDIRQKQEDVIMRDYFKNVMQLLIKAICPVVLLFSQHVDICNCIAFVQLIFIYTKSFMSWVCILTFDLSVNRGKK